jgi:hypothetical protein
LTVSGAADAEHVGAIDAAQLDVPAEESGDVEDAVTQAPQAKETLGADRVERVAQLEGQRLVHRRADGLVGMGEVAEHPHEVSTHRGRDLDAARPDGIVDDSLEVLGHAGSDRDLSHGAPLRANPAACA